MQNWTVMVIVQFCVVQSCIFSARATDRICRVQMNISADSPSKHWKNWNGVSTNWRRCRRIALLPTWPPSRQDHSAFILRLIHIAQSYKMGTVTKSPWAIVDKRVDDR